MAKKYQRLHTPSSKYLDYKRSAKWRNLTFSLTPENFEFDWQSPCAYCGEKIDTIGYDRIRNKIGYTYENVLPCCTNCNKMKSNRDKKDFLKRVKIIYENLSLQEEE